MLRSIASPGILALQTNSDYVGWSFGSPPANAVDSEINACALRVTLEVSSSPEEFACPPDAQKYHYWRASERGRIHYSRVLIGKAKLQLRADDLFSADPKIVVNSAYLRSIRFRFNNLHSPGYHLTDLTVANLLARGYAPLHCSAFRYGNSAVVIAAPPDTGKTLTTMMALSHKELHFLSEDVAFTDGMTLFPCPWTSTFRYYDQLNQGVVMRTWMRATRVLPPLELVKPPSKAKGIDAYIETSRIGAPSKISHVFILARRPGGIVSVPRDEALRLLFNLNRYEFNYIKSPLLTAYSYFNADAPDSFDLLMRERELLSSLVKNVEVHMVQAANPTEFAPSILDFLTR